ncbi:hypothetical protein [Cupriavidus sp. D39]|uniref:hypothetical protein n=1 Tax=Cupriavidus sp. D39 TaxID=2997877 RepID=UPI00227039B6|nr:hypothetical protein [Cupriavidus sp. D39]MCY0858709.1 hypothetical protein [Cupriavidus sp. D39]
MLATGRLFVCARCRAQVIVCRRCDRGQIYCDGDCSEVSRQASLSEAGRRYQRSRQGRFAHAERMRRYRNRQKKVTHHGSVVPAANALLPLTSTTPANASTSATAARVPEHCHFCHGVCSGFVRLGPLRRRVFLEVPTTGCDP